MRVASYYRAPLLLTIALAACSTSGPGPGPQPDDKTPDSKPADPFAPQVDELVHLEQGWSASQRRWFYTAAQGSKLLPYDVFMALEQADAQARFADPTHLRRFRWLIEYEGSEANDGLPLGFERSGEHVGLSCSACHTAQLDYAGKGIRVDGGPALADLEGFLHALTAALAATLEQDDKFDRFASATLGEGATDEAAREQLRAQLQALHDARAAEDAVNRAQSPYGFGRVDAFGRIFNRALRLADPHNGAPASAPVSFPVLWDTPAHDYVQWSGFAANATTGAVQRNVGQLIGVFGELELGEDPRGYPSSIDLRELLRMEEEIAKLQSPQWPVDILGELDADKLAAGEAIYAERCERCHARIDRADPERRVNAQMVRLDVIQTDPSAAMNIVQHAGNTGVLEGRKDGFADGQALGAQALTMQVVGNVIGGVIQYAAASDAELAQQLGALAASREPTPRQGQLMEDPNNPLAPLLAYKARPLNGVWASAPYLHNGSVPTLDAMLHPPDQRPRRFWLGSFAFDPVAVGFVSKPFDGGFEFDTSLPGNANGGHRFGTDLDDEQRAALVEFLKSL